MPRRRSWTAVSGESAEEARLKTAAFVEGGVPVKLAEEVSELALMTLVPEIL